MGIMTRRLWNLTSFADKVRTWTHVPKHMILFSSPAIQFTSLESNSACRGFFSYTHMSVTATLWPMLKITFFANSITHLAFMNGSWTPKTFNNHVRNTDVTQRFWRWWFIQIRYDDVCRFRGTCCFHLNGGRSYWSVSSSRVEMLHLNTCVKFGCTN